MSIVAALHDGDPHSSTADRSLASFPLRIPWLPSSAGAKRIHLKPQRDVSLRRRSLPARFRAI